MKNNRIFSLDALRGFSLFGILIMNILAFSFPYNVINPFEFFQQQDGALFKLSALFIIASFYPIFAFLFGYGLSIMYENSLRRGIAYYPMIIRRLLFLLFIGIIHGIFLFYGDILSTYALLGLIAILFVRIKPQWSLIGGVIGFSLFIILFLLPMLILPNFSELQEFVGLQELERVAAILTSTDYLSIIGLNLSYFGINITNAITAGPFSILPLILFGVYAHKINWFERIKKYSNFYIIIAIILFLVGLFIKSIQIKYEGAIVTQLVSQTLGGPVVSFSYIIFFVLICESKAIQKVLSPLQQLGRMSLTVYITQSIICMFMYYGIGFNYFNKLSVLNNYTIAIVILMLQMVLCTLYLRKFKQGPLEMIWRKVTYLK